MSYANNVCERSFLKLLLDFSGQALNNTSRRSAPTK